MQFYFIDKPIGISSFDVIRQLRKKLNTRKIGHTGTLDPLATGGLILAVGNYTKLIPYFEKDTKEYEFQIMLDGITDSFDLAEKVDYISEEEQNKFKEQITLERIEGVLKNSFTGEIEQVPPKYSALKIAGKKACDLVREGKKVEMKSRKITIFEIEVVSFDYPRLDLRAKVSAGTYIRSIAYDLGDILTTGGYISKLRRTKIGNLYIEDSQTLEDFEEDSFLDIKKIFSGKDFIKIDNDILGKLNNGLKVYGKFDYEVGKDLFVEDEGIVTNILEYDGEKITPIRKI